MNRPPVIEKDYYAVMGVPRKATMEEIRKAYRKMSLKCHPDRNGGNADKMKELAEAYEILSNEEKRAIYDEGGCEALMEFDNDPMRHARVQLQPLVVKILCNLEELYNGATKTATATRIIFDGDLRAAHTVTKEPQQEEVTAEIPPKSPYGHKIVLSGKGHRHKTDEDIVGDLIMVVCPHVKPLGDKYPPMPPIRMFQEEEEEILEHKGYTLKDTDLHYTVKLTLSEALIGFQKKLWFLDGNYILLSSVEITRPGLTKVIPNMGFGRTMRTPFGMAQKQGHLFIEFVIDLPTKLTKSQEKHIATAFGVPQLDELSQAEQAKSKVLRLADLKNPVDVEEKQPQMQQQFIINQGGGAVHMAGGQQDCTIM